MNAKSDFTKRHFRLSGTGEEVLCEDLQLLPFGFIRGYSNANERRWGIQDGCLVFKNKTGEVTTLFCDRWQGDARHVLLGKHRGAGVSPRILTALDASRREGVNETLLNELYSGDNPLDYADLDNVDDGFPHTHLSTTLAQALLEVISPQFWLEVGSMIGGSAILAAETIKRMDRTTEIVCVDPFIGDVNMWDWEKDRKQKGKWRFLHLKEGRPTIYDRFLANVVAAGHSDIILPIMATSSVGTKLLQRLYAHGRLWQRPEVIYLDSAHEPDETFLELNNCWRLLAPGGVLCGDDWGWAAVRNDVVRFSQTVQVNTNLYNALSKKLDFETTESGVLLYEKHWLLAK